MATIDDKVKNPVDHAKIVIESLVHLFGLIQPNGRFIYAHAAGDTSANLDGYNVLRHCGTVWFMCNAINALNVSLTNQQLDILSKAVQYILNKVDKPSWQDGALPCLCLVTKEHVKLGGNGLALLMLQEYRKLLDAQADSGGPTMKNPEVLIARLENYILSQVSGGDFIHKRRFSDGEVSTFRSDYYTGEALFGLFAGRRLTPQVENAAQTLMKNNYGVDIQSHWMAYTACEASEHGFFTTEMLATYISRLLASIISDDSYRGRRESTPIACRTEALSICLRTLKKSPLLAMKVSRDLILAAERCAAENLSLQLNWYSKGQFWKGDSSDKVQIDYIQHNAASFLNWHLYNAKIPIHQAAIEFAADPPATASSNAKSNLQVPENVRRPAVKLLTRPDFQDLKQNSYADMEPLLSRQLIVDEFAKQGFHLWDLGNINRLTRDEKSVFIYSAETSFTSLLGSKVFKRKEVGKQLMELAGVRTAEGRVFRRSEQREALEYATSIAPCVVKPVDGNLSRGVTVNVDSASFDSAWANAKQNTASRIIVERYVNGQKARYLVVGNRCVAVYQETPPFVRGDGKHTIAQLVAAKNAMKMQYTYLRGQKDYLIPLDAAQVSYISARGYGLNSVVKVDEFVFFQDDAELAVGSDSVNITEFADPGLMRLAEKITKHLPGLDIIGFDVIACNHCSPDGGGDYIFCEGNTWPDITEHHFPTFGAPVNVAKEIVDHCVRQMGLPRSDVVGTKKCAVQPQRSNLQLHEFEPNIYTADMMFDPHSELAKRFARLGFSSSTIGKFLLVEKDQQRILFHNSDSSFTSRLGARLLKQKNLTNMVLRDAGISVPDGRLLTKEMRDEALNFVRELGLSVIKPATGHEGIGVSVKVTDENFDVAWKEALEHSNGEILVEKYFGPAIEARYLVLDGQFLTAVRRLPPSVVGDGQHNIKQLVELKNQTRALNPYMKFFLVELNPYRVQLLAERGLSLETVPAKGEYVLIDTKGGLSSGGDILTYTDSIHPGFREIAERAYRAFPDLYLVGIDILALDHSVEPTADNYVIVEANTYVGLGGHLYPTYGEPFDVYEPMVSSCLRRLNQS